MGVRLLFVGSCYSEERNASLIAEKLKLILEKKGIKDYEILGASLLSEGYEYIKRNILVFSSVKNPPSGGFTLNTIRGFFLDLFSGAFSYPFLLIKNLKKYKDNVRFVFVDGDVFLLYLVSKVFEKDKIIFYIHSKTDYIEPHYKIEMDFIRKHVRYCYVRDELTKENFIKKGIDARFLGSAIMDNLVVNNIDFGINKNLKTIGILPGTRAEAYKNFSLILKGIKLIKDDYNYLCALHEKLDIDKLFENVKKDGWEFFNETPYPYLNFENKKIFMIKSNFADILDKSDIFIGLSGAGNEQAVGFGKAVITFKGCGAQTTKARIIEQKKLLGDALFVIKNYKEIPSKISEILNDSKLMEYIKEYGKKRMGPSGASEKIAEDIYKEFFL